MKDLIGQTFGLLTVESKAGTILQGKSKTKRTLWNCKCECGNYTTATTKSVKTTFATARFFFPFIFFLWFCIRIK